MGLNNVCLRFCLGGLPFVPGKVKFDFLHMGGFENYSANGHPVHVGEITTIPNFPDAMASVTTIPVTGGYEGSVEVTGQLTEVWVGGQEFWMDHLCAFDMTGVHEPVIIDLKNVLGQNYPNPVINSTVIPFRIKKEGEITLKVYDICGKEIATLIDADYKQGDYMVTWEAGDAPNGMYFYKLQSGSDIQVGKMSVSR
jgi:hypothetical protein